MEQIRITWSTLLGNRISVTRMGGYGLLWLWTVMMFNSIVPFSFSPDPRASLYVGLTASLVTMVVTMLFIAVALARGACLSENAIVRWAAAAAMAVGSAAAAFSDPGTSAGTGVLMFSSILTGSGSAALFVCWGEQFFGTGGRVALVELAVGSCVAFLCGFALAVLPGVAALAVIVATPLASAWLLQRSMGKEAKAVAGDAEGAKAEAGSRRRTDDAGAPDAPDTPRTRGRQAPSRATIALAVKALLGAFLVGAISGFFDVIGGFSLYIVQDVYGLYLLLAGCMATLLLSLIAVLCVRDGIFYAYRFSVLVLCLGCLLTPFLGDNATYFSVLVFAGYTCFTIILYVLCIDFSTAFRINVARCLGLGFVALYGGEIAGQFGGYGLGGDLSPYGLALLTLLAVSVLLIAHLFLFTEVDLIKLGIGEVSIAAPDATAPGADTAEEAPAIDPVPVIVARFGLTPRESDVLPLLLEGRTIQRIQETLFISAGTVSTHIRHIYQKTGSDNRQELIDLAQQIGAGDGEIEG